MNDFFAIFGGGLSVHISQKGLKMMDLSVFIDVSGAFLFITKNGHHRFENPMSFAPVKVQQRQKIILQDIPVSTIIVGLLVWGHEWFGIF